MTTMQEAATRSERGASRYVGGWPKIGIRPAIDGRRRGIRESLEDQTMGMARATAALISANLRYPDGRPAECAVPASRIGGGVEAAAAAGPFQREGAGPPTTVTPRWCYG